MLSGSARRQLAAIGRLSAVFEQEGIDHWLFGGWAVDFCVGHVTRAHDDIDFVVWRQDHAVIDARLTASGWQHAAVENDVIGAGYTLAGVLVELTLVVSDESGAVLLPLPEGPFVWSSEPFAGERRELAGVGSTTIPLSLLKGGKSAARDDPVDAAKDRADSAALSRLADRASVDTWVRPPGEP